MVRAFAWRPVALVGKGSYSLYLWHWPVIVLLRWTVGMDGIGAVALACVLTCAFAYLSWRFVEVPVRHGAWVAAWPRPTVVAAGVLVLLAGAGVAAKLQNNERQLSASVTTNLATWEPDPDLARPHECRVAYDVAHVDEGTVFYFRPSDCRHVVPGRRLFVLGDSHALAMLRAFSRLADEDNTTVEVDTLPGCPVLPLYAVQTSWEPPCPDWVRRRLRSIGDRLQQGDVVLLVSFRMSHRLADQSGPIAGATVPPVPEVARSAALAEAAVLLAPLASKGTKLLVSAPMPLFRVAPFRCMDWFNKANPACAQGFGIPRAEVERYRSAVMLSLADLRHRISGLDVWDALPIICGDQTCSATRGGEPLFFDGDHLSGYGDDVILPSLRAALMSASTWRASAD